MKAHIRYTTPKGGKMDFKTPPRVDQRPQDVFESVVWGCFAEGMTEAEMKKIIQDTVTHISAEKKRDWVSGASLGNAHE